MWPIARIDPATLHVSPPAPRGGTPVRDALNFVRRTPRLLVLFVTFTVVGTFSFNYNVSLLKLADRRFGDKELFGWLLALNSVGSLVGSLITAAQRRVSGTFFFVATLAMGVTGFGVAFAPNVWVAYAVSIPLGMGGAALVASLNAITQHDSPPDMRGRLLALGAVAFLGTTPIGAPVTGWIADRVSPEWSLAYGSVIALVAVAVGGAAWRRADAAATTSERADVPADQHEPAAVHVDHADGRGLVVEGGA
jgi:MFS family permease